MHDANPSNTSTQRTGASLHPHSGVLLLDQARPRVPQRGRVGDCSTRSTVYSVGRYSPPLPPPQPNQVFKIKNVATPAKRTPTAKIPTRDPKLCFPSTKTEAIAVRPASKKGTRNIVVPM